MLEVKEIWTTTDRLQLRRDGAHDRHHGRSIEPVVDRAQGVEPRHDSSHRRTRASSKATGLFDEYARACACRISYATRAGSSSRIVGIRNAFSTDSVTAPPSVCHGSRSPKLPRSLMSITNGTRYNCAPDTMPLIEARKP